MKLIEALEILRRRPSDGGEEVVVSLICSFTPLHLQTLLAAELQVVYPDHRIKVHTGLYGDFLGNLERAAGSKSDAIIVTVEWQDLDARLGIRSLGGWTPDVLPRILDDAKDRSSSIVNAIEAASKQMPVVVYFPTLPLLPISHTAGWQGNAFETELRDNVSAMARQLIRLPNVRLVNPQQVELLSPLAERFEVKSEILAGFPYKMSHVAIMAELLARLVLSPTPKKGLITDLDDTVWKGILGEAGPEGVSWDLDHHSHMHAVYQQFLHSLSAAGVLVGVASKNEPTRVEEVFSKRSLILPRNAIFPVEVGWGRKSESVDRILKAWNIGAEAVVFVDDSPMELAEVKAVHPAVECMRFPQDDPQAIYELLQRLRNLFGKSMLREEDAFRLDSLRRADSMRQASDFSGISAETFLEQAEAELTVTFNKENVDPRALELVNKTNQFNLNGKRHTQLSLQDYSRDSNAFLMVVSYKDKYGPLGKIAVLAGRFAGKKLWLDTWVMSCRAFSRRIEHGCFEELLAKFGVDEIEFDFVPTNRNEPLRIFLAEFLGANVESPCRLSRHDFLHRQPKTYHRVLELIHG
jgi:FkbH-like protein